ncbi:MAG: sensor histidine kinase [Candidatus Abyssobacteria bacterium SURF_5]|uniref:histidine kinase n=1 Tax=Abyssobacteria bacterium (strain SURF_5) TaxID=2093360 RepID=A0A3A4N8N7_ABYX5|nr:MAG: sensor histidine kinase [Candidatus Abyssubacteria bacterium SURF_5]
MEIKNFNNIRRMILIRVLLVPFFTMMLVFGTLIYYYATNLHKRVQEKLAYIAEGHRDLIEQFFRERAFDLQQVACANSFEELTSEGRLTEVFDQLQKRSPTFFDIGVFDDDGIHVAYVGPYSLEGRNYAQAEWFPQAQEKDVYISDVFLGNRNIPHFVIVHRQEENDRVWYLRATIDTFLFNNLVENIRIGKTGEAYLVNENGLFQTRRRSGGGLMETDPDRATYQVEASDIVSFTAEDHAGERYVYATGRLPSTGWLWVVRQEVADAHASLIRAVLIGLYIIVAGGAIVVTTAFLLASKVANQLTVCDLERRRMGCQLIMAGKLAEVGEMSAGVAHEINNPLQVMKSEETLIKDILDELEADGKLDNTENIQTLRESIDQIGLQIDRCKQIIQGLLGFARKDQATIQPTDLRSLIPSVVGMIEHRAQMENIRIIQEFESDLPLLQSDAAHLEQVLLNLLNNAIDALKQKNGGEIRVTARSSGDDIMMTVADNGCGIAPEHIEKIFLPFFTTKPVGQGTGLGLSTCYGIVENLGGQITVMSELDAGTAFTVRLPVAGPPRKAKDWQTIHKQGGVAR